MVGVFEIYSVSSNLGGVVWALHCWKSGDHESEHEWTSPWSNIFSLVVAGLGKLFT